MKTELEHLALSYDDLSDLEEFSSDPAAWLARQPSVGDDAWLLAYQDDGVTWGKLEDGKLILSRDIFGNVFPKLDPEMLQRLHFFGSQAEIRIWRKDGKLVGVRLEEKEEAENAAYRRAYLLWGDSLRKAGKKWSWVEDGQRGIHQAVPLEYPANSKGRPFQIEVRYFIEEEDSGQARVAGSRLVGLRNK